MRHFKQCCPVTTRALMWCPGWQLTCRVAMLRTPCFVFITNLHRCGHGSADHPWTSLHFLQAQGEKKRGKKKKVTYATSPTNVRVPNHPGYNMFCNIAVTLLQVNEYIAHEFPGLPSIVPVWPPHVLAELRILGVPHHIEACHEIRFGHRQHLWSVLEAGMLLWCRIMAKYSHGKGM